ncbi:hypothetical protein DX882_21490 [Vibrio fluvialis]|nr:hypothetical protein [Vibrio fluvialis]
MSVNSSLKCYFCIFSEKVLASVIRISIMPPRRQGKGSQGFKASQTGQKEKRNDLKKVFDTDDYLARMAASSTVTQSLK